MYEFYNTFIIWLLISTLLTFLAAVTAWRRSVPGLVSLTLLLVAMGIWSGSYAFEWLPVPLQIKKAVLDFTYLGVVAIPSLFLHFALTFANYEKLLSRRLLVGLAIEPLITLVLVLTNNYHSLVFASVTYWARHGIWWPEIQHGPWYTVNLIYSYAVVALGVAALLSGYMRSHPAMRRQYLIIFAAATLPWVANAVSEIFLQEFPFDITPLTFGFSASLFTFSVIRDRFMDIISVARSRLIENMSDGVLVLDMQNRIVDINPAMQRLLDQSAAPFVGTSVWKELEAWLGRSQSILHEEKSETEIRMPGSPPRYLDVRVTPLFDKYQQVKGRLLVFRDISDRKKVEKELRHANERMQGQLIEIGTLQSELRAQAVRDPLTNLFNRRYLDETLERELARAAREHYPVCVIMMDLDHFKLVNDTYGHEAGDHVLKTLASKLSAGNRRGDFACRFGGEEFVVVLPNIAMDVACRRAEDLRLTLNSLQIPYDRFSLNITISVGIASYPANGSDREAVLRAADRALYAAKRAGRNYVLTYDALESGQLV